MIITMVLSDYIITTALSAALTFVGTIIMKMIIERDQNEKMTVFKREQDEILERFKGAVERNNSRSDLIFRERYEFIQHANFYYSKLMPLMNAYFNAQHSVTQMPMLSFKSSDALSNHLRQLDTTLSRSKGLFDPPVAAIIFAPLELARSFHRMSSKDKHANEEALGQVQSALDAYHEKMREFLRETD